jgi:hypothetical protein
MTAKTLPERLRHYTADTQLADNYCEDMHAAADEIERLRAALRLHHAERTKNSTERRKSIVTGGKGSGGVFGNLLEDAYMRSALGTLTAELLAEERGA